MHPHSGIPREDPSFALFLLREGAKDTDPLVADPTPMAAVLVRRQLRLTGDGEATLVLGRAARIAAVPD